MGMVRERSPEQDQLTWTTGSRREKESADVRLMGELNRSIVLNLIRQEGSISRAEIAQRTKLSRSAVSNIINSLLDEGLVQHSGTGESNGGRRPIMLNFNYSAGHVLGVDVGANHLLALVTDLEGNVVAEHSHPFNIEVGPEVALPQIMEHIREVLALHNVQRGRVLGIGVGVPGPLDHVTGTVIAPPIMPGWDRFPLRQYLSTEFNMPVFVENDANLGAVAEKWRGAGQGYQHLAYIKIGTGIGCGLVLDGKIYRGQRGSAGEIGHITITRDGPPCKCGSYGCLESMAASPAIINRARLAIQAGRSTMLRQYEHLDKITPQEIAAAAYNGDALSRELLEDAGRYIGIALANLINLLNPGIIILGGGVASVGELIMNPIKDTIGTRSLLASYEQTELVIGRMGREAVAIGAAMMVLQEVFRGPELAVVSSN
ncbi:MAG TPA: ROK family transcriptional regulator [Chloroflexia bacterium]|nr:ROK family transcriptional regulator [Chloroflexia bacterium]